MSNIIINIDEKLWTILTTIYNKYGLKQDERQGLWRYIMIKIDLNLHVYLQVYFLTLPLCYRDTLTACSRSIQKHVDDRYYSKQIGYAKSSFNLVKHINHYTWFELYSVMNVWYRLNMLHGLRTHQLFDFFSNSTE